MTRNRSFITPSVLLALAALPLCFFDTLYGEEEVSLIGNETPIEYPFLSYQNKRVGKIEIAVQSGRSDLSFDKKDLLTKLKTLQGDPFSQYIFDQDLKLLAEEYDRVEPIMHIEGNRIDIVLKIWLRPVIKSITWEGNKYLSTKTLNRELDVEPKTLFHRVAFNKALNKVKDLYLKKGYFESQIEYRIEQDPKTDEVELIIDVVEGRSGKVDCIVFHGFTPQEESALLNQLYSKSYNTLISWFTGQGRFNEDMLAQDRQTIFNFLQSEGYADAKVEIALLESPTEGRIIIDISAEKGALYHFNTVSFDGNVLFNDREIEQIFRVHPETVYSPEKIKDTIESIKTLYGRKGHIDTSVSYDTELVEDAPLYNIHFHIDEGKEYRIGMIRVLGNVNTEDRVILRESLLVPGEFFDSSKLKITQLRLESLGFFKSVNVYPVRTQDDVALGDNYRDIYIDVEEGQTASIALFSGFASANSVYGGLDIVERNFNYRGITRCFSEGLSAVRGGGEFFQLRTSIGQKEKSVVSIWNTPHLFDTKWMVGFEFSAVLNSKLQSDDYNINTYNWTPFVAYPLGPFLTYTLRYKLRNLNIKADLPHNKKQSEQIDSTSGILSGFGTGIGYNSTDRSPKPHEGYVSLLEADLYGAGGNFTFLKASYTNTLYTPLWKYGYMRYRVDFRSIVPFGKTSSFEQIPLSERFFLGGPNSVRGYRYNILGPLYREDSQHNNKEIQRAPKGGLSSSLLSLEYVQEITSFLDAFAFIDGGSVTSRTFGFYSYRFSYGAGVNISILGKMPITIGYGFPVNPKKDQAEGFFFSLGGEF